MDPGKFLTPIKILERVSRTDEANEAVDEWKIFAVTRANIVYQSGYTAIRDDRESFSTLASIVFYRIPKLKPGMRIEVNYYSAPGIVSDVAKFDIESISYIYGDRYMSLACRRVY